MCVNVCIARLCEHAEDGSQKVYNNSNQEAMPVSDAGATLDQHCIDIALFDGLIHAGNTIIQNAGQLHGHCGMH